MNIGMLWFDNDQKVGIPTKVARAAAHYQQKYGKDPDICFVHPQMFERDKNRNEGEGNKDEERPIFMGKVKVMEDHQVLPDHFWIGVSTEEDRISSGA